MNESLPTARSAPTRRRQALSGNILIAMAATLLGVLGLELAFRVKAHLENRKTFARVFETEGSRPVPARGSRASLAHLIQPSVHRGIIYELRPGLEVTYHGGLVRTNEHGFRGPAHAPEARGAFRIVGLGDSVMFGLGVSEGETFLELLEERLRREFPGGRFEIVNTAVPGYNTVMELETLKLRGLAFEPDLVLVLFVGNDIFLPNFIRDEAQVLNPRESFLWSFIRQALRDADAADVDAGRGRRRLADRGLAETRSRTAAWGTSLLAGPDEVPSQYRDLVGWDAVSRALSELRDLGAEHGIEILFAVFGAQPSGRHARARAIAEELGLHVFDIGPAFHQYLREQGIEKYRGSPLTIGADDPHPSALGHRIMADAIFEYLRDHRLLGVD